MKCFIVLIGFFFIVSCAGVRDNSTGPQTTKAQGGVDVGNMSSAAVPNTNAYFTIPSGWTPSIENETLVLTNASSSVINARKVQLEGLISSKIVEIEKYLENKFPGRDYQTITMNGLKGVRFDLTSTETNKVSDIYLVTDNSQIIQITSELNSSENGIGDGEEILLTVRLKYKGKVIEGSEIVKLVLNITDIEHEFKYSLTNDCWLNETSCVGSGFTLKDFLLKIDGQIIELGPVKEVPFESVFVDGEYLVSPKTKISIANIYATFTEGEVITIESAVGIKADYTYLIKIKTESNDDLIIKMEIKESPDMTNKLEIKYHKLILDESEN